jgi:hypothetical protein
MYSAYGNPCSHGLGSPIRIFPDHRLLAPPRDFSQLATSFFAYLRQGIPTHALSSLTIKLTPFTEFVRHYLTGLTPVSCLDAIASAPLPAFLPAGELVASTLDCAFQCNARQIFNCQRSENFCLFSSSLQFIAFAFDITDERNELKVAISAGYFYPASDANEADWTRDPGGKLTGSRKQTRSDQVEKTETIMECNG